MTIRNSILLALIFTLISVRWGFGEAITYTVDPTRSVLTASVNWYPPASAVHLSPIQGQFVSSYTGFITADHEAGANTLKITNALISAENHANLAYAFDAIPGNYSIFTYWISTTDQDWHSVNGEIHDFAFSLSSPLIPSPGDFDPAQLTVNITSGQLDYLSTIQQNALLSSDLPTWIRTYGTAPLQPEVLSFSSNMASLLSAGHLETLTIPVDTDLACPVDGIPFLFHFSGSIVATSTVPEPTTLALLGLCPVIILQRRRGY